MMVCSGEELVWNADVSRRHILFIFRLIMLIRVMTVKCFHALMFRKHVTFLSLSVAAAPPFSLCLRHLVLAPVSFR